MRQSNRWFLEAYIKNPQADVTINEIITGDITLARVHAQVKSLLYYLISLDFFTLIRFVSAMKTPTATYLSYQSNITAKAVATAPLMHLSFSAATMNYHCAETVIKVGGSNLLR